MRYLPLTDADRSAMLDVIGAPSIDALFVDVVERRVLATRYLEIVEYAPSEDAAGGVAEIAGAIGLMIPRLRYAAGIGLALYALCVWPANWATTASTWRS